MRRDMRLVQEDLNKALTTLGYTPLNKEKTEWRRHQFHLFTKPKKKAKITLAIHEDVPSPFPPFHRARHKSKQIIQELEKIIDAYQKIRAAKT